MSLRSKLGIFVLTAEEQRTIAFIVLAFLLGLATQQYRRHHSRPASPAKTPDAAASTASPAPTTKVMRRVENRSSNAND